MNTKLNAGTILSDRYQIISVIGSGDMGSVYRARDLHFLNIEKIVAVKELAISTPDPLLRDAAIENFEGMANILASLSHRSIPKIYDYFSFESRSFMVLEYIHGMTLEAILKDGDVVITRELVQSWALEMCDALQYLHSHKPDPIIFQDLEPSSVMVNTDNHVVLVGFGMSKYLRTGPIATFVDPEGYTQLDQYQGDAARSADVTALGAILHQLLTRHVPLGEVPYSIIEDPNRESNPAALDEFEDVINRALSNNADEQFHSVEEMKNALRRITVDNDVANPPVKRQTGTTGSSPTLCWKFQCKDEVRGNLTCHDGLLLFGAYDKAIYALNPSQGDIAWTYLTGGGIVGQPSVNDNIVYIGSEDHRLYALSIKTGKPLWTYETSGPIRSSPKVVEDHVIVGSDDACIHAIDINSNRETWKINVSGPIRSSPYVSQEKVIFGCESGDVYSVDLSGQIQWSYRAKRAVTASPVVNHGTVFIASLDGMLYALDEKNGWILWKFRMDKGSVSSPCVHQKVVYLGSVGGCIYAVNTEDGNLLWKYQVDSQVSGSPVVEGNNLYCGAADGFLYCLDKLSGELKWKFETQGAITGKPAIGQDLFFVGSSDKTVYALQVISA